MVARCLGLRVEGLESQVRLERKARWTGSLEGNANETGAGC